MSKLGIRGALCTLVLSATVAAFANVAHSLSRNAEKGNLSGSKSKDAGLLIADGADPCPRPPMPAPPRVAS